MEGFGLTLESKALSWFQTLEPHAYKDFAALERDSIAAFSKMGIKHNVVAQIYAFKQKDNESIRDCANRFMTIYPKVSRRGNAWATAFGFLIFGRAKQ